MIYNYKCKKCDEEWEEIHSVNNRDKPCNEECPCGDDGIVYRPMTAPGLNFEGSVGHVNKTGNFN
tara:strand:- start:147 stop:341 length:195 start_codon:yes stop_codon:yes gene_type:complete